jgi:hypothetical protein
MKIYAQPTPRVENKGEPIVKFASFRSSLVGSTLAVIASLLLGSCGGGGAASPGAAGGAIQILPGSGTFYAGVEYTFTVAGGRPPYFLSSTEPALFAVPQTLNGHTFTVIPNNTGVVDIGLDPGSLAVRTLSVEARDSSGLFTTITGVRVAQNFFMGYGVTFDSDCPPPAAGGGTATPPPACAGGETAVTLRATINGNLVGNREYRLDIIRGPIFWVFPNGQVPGGVINGNSITKSTNHTGDLTVFFRVNANVLTQFAVIRVTDVGTQTSTEHVITIDGVDGTALEIIPDTFSFTGANSSVCGTGSGDFLVFDGTPPYTAVSAFSNILVTPETSSENPGRFRVTATNPFLCITDGIIVVTDARGLRGTLTVNTEAGSGAPPPPALNNTGPLTLGCGQSGSVSIIGGSGTFSASSPDPRVSGVLTGRTLTVTRGALDAPTVPPTTPGTMTFTITVTDGTSTTPVGITAPAVCP